MLWATCSRWALRRSNSWLATCASCSSCSWLVGAFGGRPPLPFFQHGARALKVPLHVFKPLVRLAGRLGSRPLLGGHGAADGFHQLMLHMEYVR
jgi:hypothetical protein